MKGTHYVIGFIIYILSIVLPIIVSTQTISIIHVALYAVFSLIIIAGATIDMYYYILPDEGALVLVIGGILYSFINDKSIFTTIISVMSVGAITYGLRLISHKGFGTRRCEMVFCYCYVAYAMGDYMFLLRSFLCWFSLSLSN